MAFGIAVVVLTAALLVAAYFTFRDQGVPSKHEVAREFDPEECARFILGSLPAESRERLGERGARELVTYILDYMKMSGAIANGDSSELSPERPVVLGGATSTAYLVERAESAGLQVSGHEASIAMEASVEYLRRIGAVGPLAEPEGER